MAEKTIDIALESTSQEILTISQALNNDISKPLNELIDEVKTVVNNNKDWFAVTGTDNTVFSLSSEISGSSTNSNEFALSTPIFLAPESGTYRIDASGFVKAPSGAPSSSTYIIGFVKTADFGFNRNKESGTSSFSPNTYIAGMSLGQSKAANSTEAQNGFTQTNNFNVYLEKGARYQVELLFKGYQGHSGKMTSVKVRYNKQYR